MRFLIKVNFKHKQGHPIQGHYWKGISANSTTTPHREEATVFDDRDIPLIKLECRTHEVTLKQIAIVIPLH